MVEKARIRVVGKEFPCGDEREIRETIRKLQRELKRHVETVGGHDEVAFALEDAVEMLKQDLKAMKESKP